MCTKGNFIAGLFVVCALTASHFMLQHPVLAQQDNALVAKLIEHLKKDLQEDEIASAHVEMKINQLKEGADEVKDKLIKHRESFLSLLQGRRGTKFREQLREFEDRDIALELDHSSRTLELSLLLKKHARLEVSIDALKAEIEKYEAIRSARK